VGESVGGSGVFSGEVRTLWLFYWQNVARFDLRIFEAFLYETVSRLDFWGGGDGAMRGKCESDDDNVVRVSAGRGTRAMKFR
jgi:hypothetical protein